MIEITGIKCGDKFYITDGNNLGTVFVNGKQPEKTFHPKWFLVTEEPKKLQRTKRMLNINYRYELIDKTMESKKTPLVFKREDVAIYDDDDYCWRWKDEYALFRSLYTEKSDPQSDILEDIEFTYSTIMEVDEIREFGEFGYTVPRSQWKKDGMTTIDRTKIQHQVLDQIVFPDLLLPTRPCALTPKQSYDIVRQYVKQHINYDFATITSDYDFCFTVAKKIPFSEPVPYEVDVNNNNFGQKRKRKPKFETRYHVSRTFEIFNMAPKPYQKYKVIQGFRGDDQDDLKDNIDSYCEALIATINEPVVDCPHCKGRGVIKKDGEI